MRHRVLYLWLPRLATDRAIAKRPALANVPFALVQRDGNRVAVVAVNDAGALAGGAPGQSLSDARTLCPALQAVPAEPDADRRALARLAEGCGRFTPWVGLDPAAGPFEGGLFLDITGCAHLFGGESALVRRPGAFAARFGLAARAAIADTPGAAWAWARFGPADAPILPRGAHARRLAPLPVAALRLAAADVETLDRLGLRTVGDLAALPRASLALRFGEAPLRRLDQARGAAAEPVSPLRPVVPYAAEAGFGEPLATPEAVAAALERLLATLTARLGREGLGARRLAFTLYRIDGSAATARVGVSRAARNPDHLSRLFAPKLEALDPDPGVEALRLEAAPVEPVAADQAALCRIAGPTAGVVAGPGTHREPSAALAALIDRLANRLGPAAVTWPAPVETPLPEAQVAPRSAVADGPADWSAWPATASRPVRLLARPEPVEPIRTVSGATVPDATVPDATISGAADGTAPRAAPPAAIVWQRRSLLIRRAVGPERLLGPWWRAGGDDSRHRDYWLAEDAAGRRLWLFRDHATGRWAVHGVMG